MKKTKKTATRPRVSAEELETALGLLLKRIQDQRGKTVIPAGCRLRRDAWMRLQEKGILTAPALAREQERIYHKSSNLPSEVRSLVTTLVTQAVKEVLEKKIKD